MKYETLKPLLFTFRDSVIDLIDDEELREKVLDQVNQLISAISNEYLEESDSPSGFLTGDVG